MHAKETPLRELERAERTACNRYLRLLQAFMSADVIEHARRLCDRSESRSQGLCGPDETLGRLERRPTFVRAPSMSARRSLVPAS